MVGSTTAPTHKVHIKSGTATILAESTNAGANASIWFNSNVGGTQANRWEVGTNISAGSSFEVYDRVNGASRMTINSSGSVGIGATSLIAKMHVKGSGTSSSTNAIFAENSGSAGIFAIRDNGDAFILGNTGIGTTAPAAGIHLTKSSSSNYLRMDDGSNCLINFSADTNTAVMQVQETGFSSWKPLELRANYLVFKPNNTETMRLTSTGLSIGTSSSLGGKLTISGKDDSGAGDLLRLQFDNSPPDTGITFVDIFNTVKNRISMDAGNSNDLQISAGTQMKIFAGTTGSSAGDQKLLIDGDGATIHNGRELRVKRPNGSGDIRLFNTTTYATLESTVDPIYIKSANAIRFDTSGNNQRMLLDNAGNLLVGTTDTNVFNNSSGSGINLRASGEVQIAVNEGEALYLNRMGTDGRVVNFRKAGSFVGGIGIANGDLHIDGDTGIRFQATSLMPRNGGSDSNGAIDLGLSSNRFKDLYLSGTANADKFALSSVIYIDSPTSSITRFDSGGGDHVFYSGSTNELFRATNSGNFLIGSSSLPAGSVGGFGFSSDQFYTSTTSTSANYQIRLYNGNGLVGSIVTSGSATTYNTSSDERLKDNIVNAPTASEDIDAIQVRSFDWKADGEHQKYGMVAQELLEVAPDAVTKGDTPDDMMSVDYSKLVPMLIKEIQSLRQRVAQLEE